MNAEELITIARDIADRQYPDDLMGRKSYHIGLLETRIRELVKRVNELERHPILDLPVFDPFNPSKTKAEIMLSEEEYRRLCESMPKLPQRVAK